MPRDRARTAPPFSAALLADCGGSIGLGHLRRSLVLAEALSAAGLRARVATPGAAGVRAIEAAGIEPMAWPSRPQDLAPHDVLVIDHYGIAAETMTRWRRRARLRLVIDDLADHALDADLVLNQNLFAHQISYDGVASCPVLRGPGYALVDPAFHAIAERRTRGARALVSFGGSDDGSLALRAAGWLRDAGFAGPIDLVVSPLREVARDLAAAVPEGIKLHHGASMPALMAGAFVYVGGAGSTIFEAAAAGLAMLPVAIAANQQRNVAALRALGLAALPQPEPAAAVTGLRSLLADPARHRLLDLVPEGGPTRVVRHVLARLALCDRSELSLRY